MVDHSRAVEYAVVKRFSTRRGFGYGFLCVLDSQGRETGEDVFFHFHDGRFPHENLWAEGCPVPYRLVGNTPEFLSLPTPGDKIVFSRERGRNGDPKASPWSYSSHWDEPAVSLPADIPLIDDPYDDETDADIDAEVDLDQPVSISTARGRVAKVGFGLNTQRTCDDLDLQPGYEM